MRKKVYHNIGGTPNKEGSAGPPYGTIVKGKRSWICYYEEIKRGPLNLDLGVPLSADSIRKKLGPFGFNLSFLDRDVILGTRYVFNGEKNEFEEMT